MEPGANLQLCYFESSHIASPNDHLHEAQDYTSFWFPEPVDQASLSSWFIVSKMGEEP